jgi:hypothetical protein
MHSSNPCFECGVGGDECGYRTLMVPARGMVQR